MSGTTCCRGEVPLTVPAYDNTGKVMRRHGTCLDCGAVWHLEKYGGRPAVLA